MPRPTGQLLAAALAALALCVQGTAVEVDEYGLTVEARVESDSLLQMAGTARKMRNHTADEADELALFGADRQFHGEEDHRAAGREAAALGEALPAATGEEAGHGEGAAYDGAEAELAAVEYDEDAKWQAFPFTLDEGEGPTAGTVVLYRPTAKSEELTIGVVIIDGSGDATAPYFEVAEIWWAFFIKCFFTGIKRPFGRGKWQIGKRIHKIKPQWVVNERRVLAERLEALPDRLKINVKKASRSLQVLTGNRFYDLFPYKCVVDRKCDDVCRRCERYNKMCAVPVLPKTNEEIWHSVSACFQKMGWWDRQVCGLACYPRIGVQGHMCVRKKCSEVHEDRCRRSCSDIPDAVCLGRD